jgi:hypothetical protein
MIERLEIANFTLFFYHERRLQSQTSCDAERLSNAREAFWSAAVSAAFRCAKERARNDSMESILAPRVTAC